MRKDLLVALVALLLVIASPGACDAKAKSKTKSKKSKNAQDKNVQKEEQKLKVQNPCSDLLRGQEP